MLRTLALRAFDGRGGSRVCMELHAQQAVASPQSNNPVHPVIGRCFAAVCFSFHLISQIQRCDQMVRRRTRGEKLRTWGERAEVPVIVVEGRQVEPELTGRLISISRLIGHEFFGLSGFLSQNFHHSGGETGIECLVA